MRNIPKNKTERLTAVLQDLGFRLMENWSCTCCGSVLKQKIGKAFPKPRKATKRYATLYETPSVNELSDI